MRRNPFRLFRALSVRDRVLVSLLVGLIFLALLFWAGALYVTATKTIPERGGEYTEGIAAQPRYVNPILSQTSEADADLVELIYSGLFRFNAQGKLVKHLAEDYTVSEDGKTYTVTLRQGVQWHDGEELTADDVIFTIDAIQNPSYKSPLRPNWLAIEAATVDRYTVVFTLKKAYVQFLESLTVGILPKHLWESITPENFLLADYNLTPVGSGPYQFFNFDKDSNGNMLSYEVRAFPKYFESEPYISKMVFHFYPDEAALIDAYNRKEIMGIHTVGPQSLPELEERKSTRVYEISIPRIFAVFFNPTKNAAIAHREVRQALAYATDREALVNEVLAGRGEPAYTAFVPFMEGFASHLDFPKADAGRANSILEAKGWKRGDDGIRRKDGVTLEFELMAPLWPELAKTAEILKNQWEAVGARVTVSILGASELQRNHIRPRDYQALLFGEAAMLHSDPYSFWHSSQKHDPGLNLSLFEEKRADDLLVALREEKDENKRRDLYRDFQQVLIDEQPALFLYTPKYLYVMNGIVKGVELQNANAPADRFSDVHRWYIQTQRVRK